MNNEFQKRTDQRYFIKREPVINEELEITPVIDLDAVKTEHDEPNQSEKNDLIFPIETLSNFPIENQANVLKTYARNKAKITKHYTTQTSKNSDNLTVPELLENSLPNEKQPLQIKIETIEQIDVTDHKIFEPLELDIKVNILKPEENVVKQHLGTDVTDNLINGKSALKDTAQKVARKAQKPGGKSTAQKVARKAQKPGGKSFKYTCDFCNEKFMLKYKMHEHMRTHKGKKPSCRCVHRHLNVHVIAPGGVPFACNLCKLVTCTRADLNRHMGKFHDMKCVDYMCHHCHSSFSHKDDLIEHLKSQSDNYQCSKPMFKFLEKRFKFQYDYLTKKEKKFIDNYKLFSHPYECAVCPYKCTIQVHVKAHIIQHNAMLAKKREALKKKKKVTHK